MNMYAYADPCFEKLLSDNRDRYIQQSSQTRYGQVAQLPHRDREAIVRRFYQRESFARIGQKPRNRYVLGVVGASVGQHHDHDSNDKCGRKHFGDDVDDEHGRRAADARGDPRRAAGRRDVSLRPAGPPRSVPFARRTFAAARAPSST